MAQQTVYCEECLEDIPADEVYWEDGRLYCRRCGSELEPPDSDVFEDILDHRAGMRFRDEEPPDVDEEEEDDEPHESGDVAAEDEEEEPAGDDEDESRA